MVCAKGGCLNSGTRVWHVLQHPRSLANPNAAHRRYPSLQHPTFEFLCSRRWAPRCTHRVPVDTEPEVGGCTPHRRASTMLLFSALVELNVSMNFANLASMKPIKVVSIDI